MSENTMKMRFTVEEFDIMVNELIYQEEPSYDMLFTIAEKVLKPKFLYLCSQSKNTRNRGFEEDLLQLSFVKLYKSVIKGFLKRPDKNGQVNNSPEEFNKWLHRLGKNVFLSFVKKECNSTIVYEGDSENSDGIEDYSDIISDTEFDADYWDQEKEEYRETLQDALDYVLSPEANISVYKVLTWLAMFVYILEEDITKIDATHLLENEFKDKTLLDMYTSVIDASQNIHWLMITATQQDFIVSKLKKEWKDGIMYAEARYGDFSMNTGLRKSISDWVNRINDKLKAYESKR